MQKLHASYLIGLLLMAACNGRQPIEPEPQKPEFDKESPTWLPINPKAYDYVSSVKDYGDTLRIITTKPPGDTVYAYYLDLKGISDDDFDGTFTVKSTFRFIPNDTAARYKTSEEIEGYRFYFDGDLRDSLFPAHKTVMGSDTLRWVRIGMPDFLELGSLKVVNVQTNEFAKGVLVEQYVTEFSGGHTLYVIDANGDTVMLRSLRDYIK